MRYRRLEKNVKLILGRRKDINRVIVTGVAGFTGSAVARHIILDTPDAVCVVDKLTCAGNLKKLTPIANDPRFKFEKVDICNKTELDRGYVWFLKQYGVKFEALFFYPISTSVKTTTETFTSQSAHLPSRSDCLFLNQSSRR